MFGKFWKSSKIEDKNRRYLSRQKFICKCKKKLRILRRTNLFTDEQSPEGAFGMRSVNNKLFSFPFQIKFIAEKQEKRGGTNYKESFSVGTSKLT